MSDNVELGKTLATWQDRDAIHVAVIAAIAEGELAPGTHVLLDGRFAKPSQVGVGIVDPFLLEPVKDRQWCWIVLYPNTITALRHQWDHALISHDGCGVTSYSEKWLRDFAVKVDADYFSMMRVAGTHCDQNKSWPDYLIEGGKWEGQGTPDEFWKHYKIVTGKEPPNGELPGIFSCSC